MLGNYVKSYLEKYITNDYEVVSFTREDYDISKLTIDSLRSFIIEKIQDTDHNNIIINCAGIIPQSSKQRKLDNRLYFTVNTLFPIILSLICEENNVKMIHITTDCVFSGDKGNYDELSLHDETNDYGLSKSLGEKCNATIIRTSIIGEEINNKRSLLEWVRANQNNAINGYVNHHWNGVTCLQLAKIIFQIITENNYWKGIRHIFSPNSVNKYELVSIINDVYDLNITINKFSAPSTVDKTISSIYPTIFDIPPLKEQIIEIKSFQLK